MGEEWGERRPFTFFTDFSGELGNAVREGRRREFKKWPQFQDPANREKIPDPNLPSTMTASLLDWGQMDSEDAKRRLAHVRHLLSLRANEIAPRLRGLRSASPETEIASHRAFSVTWTLSDGAKLRCMASFDDDRVSLQRIGGHQGRAIFESEPGLRAAIAAGEVPPCSVLFEIDEGGA